MTTELIFDDPEPEGLLTLVKADGEPKHLTAEEVWPFVDKVTGRPIENPDFEDYAFWLQQNAWRQQLLDGLNWPRSFTPRPYQLEGAIHLRMGVPPTKSTNGTLELKIPEMSKKMIYDQPGLGKTLQAAMALTTPAIVTCPGYLVSQWEAFFKDQYPQWKVVGITQQMWREKRQELLDTPHDIWIVNHEMWASRREPFKGGQEPKMYIRGKLNPDYTFEKWYEWSQAKEAHLAADKRISFHWPRVRTLVIDESHHMRNRDASQSRSCSTFADTCDFVFLLTASPQYKDVRDWWNQLRIMDPRRYTSYRQWENYFTYQANTSGTLWKVYDRRAKELQETVAEYAMGRGYNDVGLYLPDLIQKTVTVKWHPDLKKAYDTLRRDMAIESENGYKVDINPAAMLHTLRLFTGCPEKVDAVKKIVEDIPGDKPIIIFCWYRDAAELLAEEFSLLPSSVKITGEFTQAERVRRAVQPDSRVKCVTMAAASEGVDWSDASTVIFFEEDYVPGRLYQALSRVRRWSEQGEKHGKEPIIVYYVHMDGSVDEAVHFAVVERNGDIRKILRRALK